MIIPNKYTDYNTSIINLSATILGVLKINQQLSYNNLLSLIEKKHGEKSKFNFQNALNLLFLFGTIEYLIQTDMLVLTA